MGFLTNNGTGTQAIAEGFAPPGGGGARLQLVQIWSVEILVDPPPRGGGFPPQQGELVGMSLILNMMVPAACPTGHLEATRVESWTGQRPFF